MVPQRTRRSRSVFGALARPAPGNFAALPPVRSRSAAWWRKVCGEVTWTQLSRLVPQRRERGLPGQDMAVDERRGKYREQTSAVKSTLRTAARFFRKSRARSERPRGGARFAAEKTNRYRPVEPGTLTKPQNPGKITRNSCCELRIASRCVRIGAGNRKYNVR